jgi:maleate isomerase
MADPLEYAPRGLIGALTPQANTTVEPELAILMPPGVAWISARLTSPAKTIEARLADYLDNIDATLDRFANAPVGAYAFACTGASYLIGPDGEDALVGRIEAARGHPFVTAARAVTEALRTLGARRIGLVSPYPAGLTETSVGYWRERGFAVDAVAGVFNDGSDFHPIYSLSAASADAALHELADQAVDAIVMLGTGMPTLGPIARAAGTDGPPVLSCMLALVWRTVIAVDGSEPDRASLGAWITAERWGERLTARTSS